MVFTKSAKVLTLIQFQIFVHLTTLQKCFRPSLSSSCCWVVSIFCLINFYFLFLLCYSLYLVSSLKASLSSFLPIFIHLSLCSTCLLYTYFRNLSLFPYMFVTIVPYLLTCTIVFQSCKFYLSSSFCLTTYTQPSFF